MIRALDLTNLVLRSKNWPTVTTIEGTRTLTAEKALQALNLVGLLLGRFYYWRFLHTRGTLTTVPEYDTGTVAMTVTSDVVTGTSTAWSPLYVDYTMKVRSFEELYRVREVLSTTSLLLDHPYNGSTATGLSYQMAQDRYFLPEDFDVELGVFQFKDPRNVTILSPERFDERRFGPTAFGWGGTSSLITDDPTHATIEVDGTGRPVLVLDPYPKDRILIPFSYYRLLKKLDRDEDFWPFPPYIESVLHDGALHYLFRDAADDPRGETHLQEFFATRSELSGLTRMADQFTRFQPDTGLRRLAQARRSFSSRIRQGIEDEYPLNSPRP